MQLVTAATTIVPNTTLLSIARRGVLSFGTRVLTEGVGPSRVGGVIVSAFEVVGYSTLCVRYLSVVGIIVLYTQRGVDIEGKIWPSMRGPEKWRVGEACVHTMRETSNKYLVPMRDLRYLCADSTLVAEKREKHYLF